MELSRSERSLSQDWLSILVKHKARGIPNSSVYFAWYSKVCNAIKKPCFVWKHSQTKLWYYCKALLLSLQHYRICRFFFRLRDRHRNGQTLVYSLANLEVLSSRQKRRLLSSSVGQIEPYLATPSTRTLDFRDKFLSFASTDLVSRPFFFSLISFWSI